MKNKLPGLRASVALLMLPALIMLVDLGTGKLFLEDFNGEYPALKKPAPGRAKPAARPTGS